MRNFYSCWSIAMPFIRGLLARQVSEWKHRGSDFFSFKSKLVTVDFWDFSGDPDYHIIYSCFKCSSSLHLVVCNAQLFEQPALLKWLAGIQATSSERIPVIIVFTHLDKFPSREQKDGFRREVIQWLHSWEATVQKGNHAPSAVPQGVKNLSGEDITSSFESQPASGATLLDNHETPGEYSPLFPFVHRVFFVNPVTGDGTGALRKCLVKIATGSLSQELAVFSGFQMIGRDIPSTYIHIEAIVRHLRDKFRSSRREGEQRPFYTISELVYKKLKRPLSEYKIEERDFTAALYFLHEVEREGERGRGEGGWEGGGRERAREGGGREGGRKGGREETSGWEGSGGEGVLCIMSFPSPLLL